MKVTVKETSCPLCLSQLVVNDGVITCEDECELTQDGWHRDTWMKLEPVLEWFRDGESQ